MALLGFKAQFADAVESGEKRQTIRAERKRPIKVGEKLYLYTGLRTKKCRKLWKGDPPMCDNAFGITINESGKASRFYNYHSSFIAAHGCEDIAKRDGFNSWADLVEWFKKEHGLPFKGQVIRW